jgi:hypothetical protein
MASNEIETASERFDKDIKRADGGNPLSSNSAPRATLRHKVGKLLFDYPQASYADQNPNLHKLIDEANYAALDQIVKVNTGRMKWAERMQQSLEEGCELIKMMSVIAFFIGLIFIVIPFILFLLSTPRDSNLLWFSGIGLAETVAILVYQPMNRVQKATSDMVQSTIILSSWATEVGLTMFLLNLEEIRKNDKTADTMDLISKITGDHILWLQYYTEDNKTPSNAESKPKATTDNQTLPPNPKTPA